MEIVKAWVKEVEPEEGMKWQVKMTVVEEVAKDWEEPVIVMYPHKPWVGLTTAEVADAYARISNAEAPFSQFAELLEAKLKEKNANPTN